MPDDDDCDGGTLSRRRGIETVEAGARGIVTLNKVTGQGLKLEKNDPGGYLREELSGQREQ